VKRGRRVKFHAKKILGTVRAAYVLGSGSGPRKLIVARRIGSFLAYRRTAPAWPPALYRGAGVSSGSDKGEWLFVQWLPSGFVQ
jgi:hypothetical protein